MELWEMWYIDESRNHEKIIKDYIHEYVTE